MTNPSKTLIIFDDFPNTCFISDFCCDLCGKHDLVPSVVKLQANYGSRYHDGESLELHVCGDCIDKFFDVIEKESEVK